METAYDHDLHYNEMLRELRDLTDPKRWHKSLIKRSEYFKDAAKRNAPMLSGFFVEEPQWRERLMKWCDQAAKRKS